MAKDGSVFDLVLQPLRALALGGLLACGLAQNVHAQPARDAMANASLPASGRENEWHFDARTHRVWVHKDGSWLPFPADNCRSILHCNGHVIVQNGFYYMLAQEDGTVIVAKTPEIRCLDGFIIVDSPKRIEYLINQASDTVSALVNNCKIYRDTVQSEVVYCFPRYQQGLERYNCFDLRNWGMMNTQGQWVIEPKFDKPFVFKSGRAAVIYKGAHLQIDESGEFVQ